MLVTPPVTPPSPHVSTAAAENFVGPSDIVAFNTRTPWPSEEARLKLEWKASLPSPPLDNESTDSLSEDAQSVFMDLPAGVSRIRSSQLHLMRASNPPFVFSSSLHWNRCALSLYLLYDTLSYVQRQSSRLARYRSKIDTATRGFRLHW